MPRSTNFQDWWLECKLSEDHHELWWLEYESDRGGSLNFDDLSKSYFILSQEAYTVNLPDAPNLYFFDSIVHDSRRIYPFMQHWNWLVHTEHRLGRRHKLKINPHSTFIFDALLGLTREHRDLAHDWIQSNPEIKKRTYLTYYGSKENSAGYDLPGVDKSNFGSGCGGGDTTIIDGESYSFSYILPVEIYNETLVSLITETNPFSRGYSFFTEKIGKALMTGRPFIVLSNPGYLRRLRSFGFQTFSQFIDESYDDIENDHERWIKALEQLYKFVEMPRDQILPLMSSVLEHNKNIFWRAWMDDTKHMIREIANTPG